MVERVLAQETLATCVIEGDETGNHRFRRSGLGVCDGLLEGNASGFRIKWNIRQANLFGPALIAEAEIDPPGFAQVSGQTPN